jgi:hypothetical protein
MMVSDQHQVPANLPSKEALSLPTEQEAVREFKDIKCQLNFPIPSFIIIIVFIIIHCYEA